MTADMGGISIMFNSAAPWGVIITPWVEYLGEATAANERQP